MALFKCHECKNKVSEHAAFCPKCGVPIQKEKLCHSNGPDPDYIKLLRDCEHQAIDQYDKTLLTLSAGAFGVAIAFLKDVVKSGAVHGKFWLIGAWVGWGGSLALTLIAFYLSHQAMRFAHEQYQKGCTDDLGGIYGRLVKWFNPTAGLLFLFGLFCMLVFVTKNFNYETKVSISFATSVSTSSVTPLLIQEPSTNVK